MTGEYITLEGGEEVTVMRSTVDNALVVFIDTVEGTGQVRVHLNENTLYRGDPEVDE